MPSTECECSVSAGQALQSALMTQWTPGPHMAQHSILSESVTLRGATCNGASASRSAAEEYLQHVFLTEGKHASNLHLLSA